MKKRLKLLLNHPARLISCFTLVFLVNMCVYFSLPNTAVAAESYLSHQTSISGVTVLYSDIEPERLVKLAKMLAQVPQEILDDFSSRGWVLCMESREMMDSNDHADSVGYCSKELKEVHVLESCGLDTLAHELGHYIDDTYDLSSSDEFANLYDTADGELIVGDFYDGKVTKRKEFFAECFATIVYGSNLHEPIKYDIDYHEAVDYAGDAINNAYAKNIIADTSYVTIFD